MITQLFKATDERRETAFLWNYSAMNIGFFISIGMAGFFQEQQAFKSLFLVSSIGNVAALLLVLYYYKKLKDVNTYYSLEPAKLRSSLIGIFFMFLTCLSMRGVLAYVNASLEFILDLGAIMGILVIILAMKQAENTARKKLWAYFILGWASLVFLTLYQLIPVGLVLFIQRNVDRHFLGFMIEPQWYQNINSVILIFAGPLLSYLFQGLRKRGYVVNVSLQFSFALILIGLGFAILPVGISLANPQGFMGSGWIVLCYILLSLGELCIIPVGYALVGELSPIKLRGLLMGIWLMLTGVSSAISNIFSKEMLGNHHVTNPLLTNGSFSVTFLKMSYISVILGILLFLVSPWIQRKLIKVS